MATNQKPVEAHAFPPLLKTLNEELFHALGVVFAEVRGWPRRIAAAEPIDSVHTLMVV